MGAEEKDLARVDRALSLIADAFSGDAKKADAILKEEGTNLSESVRKNLAFLKKMQGKAELRAAAEEREGSEARLSELRETTKERISKYPNPKKALARLLGGTGEVSLSFRKLEEMDEKDVIDALGDAELLALLERLEGSEE